MTEKPKLDRKLSLKPSLVAEFAQAYPNARIKSIDFDSMGGVRRVEWYDEDNTQSDALGKDTDA